ncbi:tartrate dehydrogenase, partial [Burkholderia pseudomallei]
MSEKVYRIAVIPGDGIGVEVMPEGLRALDAESCRFGLRFAYEPIEWASCDYYAEHGQMMPHDWKSQQSGMDALLFG